MAGGEIDLEETQFRIGNRRVCPFAESAKIVPGGYTLPLQRLIVDFSADMSYSDASKKMKEHHGLDICVSVIMRITQGHAEAVLEAEQPDSEFPQYVSPYKVIIAMTDGGMVPIVFPADAEIDKRKGKIVLWREAKISLAHLLGSVTPFYAGCIEGGVEAAGLGLLHCAVLAGFGSDSVAYVLGDGAVWIPSQVEERFGEQGYYLVDFFHVCEYLAAAAKAIELDENARKAWIEARKEELKTGRLSAVLAALSPCIEPDGIPNDKAPVRTCHRYLSDRANQLDYARAIKEGRPIGSGEIESAHRYVVQKRLKLAGAWWTVKNAESMIALRIMRLNGGWEKYWKDVKNAPPKPANSNSPKPEQIEMRNAA